MRAPLLQHPPPRVAYPRGSPPARTPSCAGRRQPRRYQRLGREGRRRLKHHGGRARPAAGTAGTAPESAPRRPHRADRTAASGQPVSLAHQPPAHRQSPGHCHDPGARAAPAAIRVNQQIVSESMRFQIRLRPVRNPVPCAPGSAATRSGSHTRRDEIGSGGDRGAEPAGDDRIALVPGAVERSKMRCPRT